MTQKTYEKLFSAAIEKAQQGRSVILDAAADRTVTEGNEGNGERMIPSLPSLPSVKSPPVRVRFIFEPQFKAFWNAQIASVSRRWTSLLSIAVTRCFARLAFTCFPTE
jgi:hypothetical protein